MWYKLNVKPFSVNQQYDHINKKKKIRKGNLIIITEYSKRVTSGKYLKFQRVFNKAIEQVPIFIIQPTDELHLHFEFGFSSKLSDTSNAIKSSEDLIADHFSYNDKQNKRVTTESFIVDKGEENIAFKLEKIKTKNRRSHV
jgi:hypothetical protein